MQLIEQNLRSGFIKAVPMRAAAASRIMRDTHAGSDTCLHLGRANWIHHWLCHPIDKMSSDRTDSKSSGTSLPTLQVRERFLL